MKLSLITLCLALSISCFAQDDLLDLIDDQSNEKENVYATFKGSRLILGHSTKMKNKKELEFLISHRFGKINDGAHNFFGLDAAFIRLGLEYGISDKINIGIGRSSFDKTFDGFVKYKLIQQSKGDGSFPLSVVLFNSIAIKSTPKESDDPNIEFSDRLASAHQLLISSKLSSDISIQIMPTYIHKNVVAQEDDNDQIAIGIGGRLKLTQSLALNTEYYYRLSPPDGTPYMNSFSVGFDIETGGHVFQLHFTNSIMTVERSFITETSDDFFDGDIHFGFNISRTFQLGSKKGW